MKQETMKVPSSLLAAVTVAVISISAPQALAEQRDFPTGERGATVTYVDEGGPGHPTACTVAVAAGLPALGVSFIIFSNNTYTVTVASQQQLPHIAGDSPATVKINRTHIFSKVMDAFASGRFNVISLKPLDNTSLKLAYEAINQLAFNTVRIDVIADDAQLPSVVIPAKPGVADALETCQRYLITH